MKERCLNGQTIDTKINNLYQITHAMKKHKSMENMENMDRKKAKELKIVIVNPEAIEGSKKIICRRQSNE